MPYTVSTSLDQFYNAINLGSDHRELANTRRTSIVTLLESKLTVVDSFTSGSIPKFTALKGHADLDIIVQLHWKKHIDGKTCTQVLAEVRAALAGKSNSVRRNGQAVTLRYTSWPDVDVVPVARVNDANGNVDHYLVPNSNDDVWIKSRPKKLSAEIESASSKCGASFRKAIKMMKEWNRAHSKYLQSYHIEVMALKSMTSALDSDFTWVLYQFFESAYNLTASSLWYELGFSDDYLSTQDRYEVRKRLHIAVDQTRSAWFANRYDKHEEAIRIYKQLFGERFPAYG